MRWVYVRGVVGLSLVVGCAGAPSDPAASESELTETATVLDEDAKHDLASAGFTGDEIKAVAESVAISKLLGVKSFVAEANDGNLAEESSVRRESHGKHQGCLRAKVDVELPEGAPEAGVFVRGASYPAWTRLSNGGQYSTIPSRSLPR
jgi:hypothetical protein